MEHVVFYQSAQGTPAFRRVASLEDAVSFAEHLRNVEGVTDFSVYSLAPVTLSMRAYYHVEVSGGEAAAAAPSAPPAEATAAPAAAPSYPDTAPLSPTNLDAAPPIGTPASDPAPAMSFNALEQASTPLDQIPPPGGVPFAAAPLPPATDSAAIETFVKDAPAPLPSSATNADDTGATSPADTDAAAEPTPIDPNVVDPTVEEVVPVAPGRRSMGFFARS